MNSDTYIVVSVTQMQTPLKVPAVQGDTGRRLTMVFSDLIIPSGAAAAIYVRKSNGEIYNSGTVGTADNLSTATFELTTAALEEAGEIPAQVRITDGEDIITSFKFALCVQESLIDSGAIEGTNEFTALEEAIAAANAATKNANNAASAAEQTANQLQTNYQQATAQAQQDFETATEVAQAAYQAATKINLKLNDSGVLVDGDGAEVSPQINGSLVVSQNIIASGILSAANIDYQCISSAGYIFGHISGSDPVAGYGNFSALRFGNLVKIDFGIYIGISGTSNTAFSYGLLASAISSALGETVTPIPQKFPVTFFRGGNLNTDTTNYCAYMLGSNVGIWQPGRIYTPDGDSGIWSPSNMREGDRIIGTVYGTIST